MADTIFKLAELLKKNNLILMTAESCTGGLVAKLCTGLSGSSAWFAGSVVAYSNEIKQTVLGVKSETLTQVGAVSEPVAKEMAQGLAELAKRADNSQSVITLAITGIAGPHGATADKPVGTVCFAWSHGAKILAYETRQFSGNRDEVRSSAAEYALQKALQLCQENIQ